MRPNKSVSDQGDEHEEAKSYITCDQLRSDQYNWSSYGDKELSARDLVLDVPPFYLSLGKTIQEMHDACADYLLGTVPDHEIKLIREACRETVERQ